jgi:hypothetical protein
MTQFSVAARRLIGAAGLSMCIVSPVSAQEKPFATLDGKPPLVIGHRGLPGLMPEETQASYDMAAALHAYGRGMRGVCRAHVRLGSNVGAAQMADEVGGSARPGNWSLSG